MNNNCTKVFTLLFLLALALAGCDRETFDIMEEQGLPPDPVIVNGQADYVRIITENGDTAVTEGFAVYSLIDNDFRIINTSDVSFSCLPSGGINLSASQDTADFFLFLRGAADENTTMPTMLRRAMLVNRMYDEPFTLSSDRCDEVFSMEFSEFSQERITGTASGVFIQYGPVDAGLLTCEAALRVEVYIDFSLPVNLCQ